MLEGGEAGLVGRGRLVIGGLGLISGLVGRLLVAVSGRLLIDGLWGGLVIGGLVSRLVI